MWRTVLMDVNKDSYRPHVSRLEIIDTGRRRRFTDEAKVRIVEESYSGRRLVSATAMKYGISRSQLHAWRRALRAGRLVQGGIDGFVPALVVPETQPSAREGSVFIPGRMEVMSANGRRVIVDRDVDVEALMRIIRGLEALR